MEKIIINGNQKLTGEITVSGSKNAVLPIIVATILAEDKCIIQDAPNLADVKTICSLLSELGAKVVCQNEEIEIDTTAIEKTEATLEQVRKMRASFLLLGPLLARFGKAKISLPGGCAIGTRPIDLHLKGLAALGAKINIGHGAVEAIAPKLKGAKVYLDFPSVGATESIMMAGSLAEGLTTIENAAEEPEIVDLANFLNHMGAKVSGAGTNIIRIEGVKSLKGCRHTVIPDRIEAGTFMVLAAATKSDILIKNAIIDHLKPMVAKLLEMGVHIYDEAEGIRVKSPAKLEAVDIKTLPYPGFPTDMQAQMMSILTIANGTSVISETVFENRFMHVDELKRMGAKIIIEGHSAIVKGVPCLTGAPVKATDLRAGAALIIAALMAEGTTEITELHHIDRGYDNIVEKLKNIGADIRREVCSN